MTICTVPEMTEKGKILEPENNRCTLTFKW